VTSFLQFSPTSDLEGDNISVSAFCMTCVEKRGRTLSPEIW
jgi:hypothetical protein